MNSDHKKSFFKVLFYSSFFTIILIIFLIIGCLSFFRITQREKDVKSKIFSLKTEIKKLEGEKIDFGKAIEYFKTDFYKEKEAREKLGMKKPDENVIVILPTEEDLNKKEEKSNVKKWWQYIFK